MGYRHVTTVRFRDVDQAAVAFFPRIFELVHEAFEEMLWAGGLPLHAVLGEGSFGMPLVGVRADFLRPLRLGDRIEVVVEVARRSPGRMELAYEVRGPEGEVRARLRHHHAFVSLEDFRPVRMPVRLLRALRRAGMLEDDGGGHELLDHTADVRLRAWGEDLGHALDHAVAALGEVVLPPGGRPPPLEARPVDIRAADLQELTILVLEACILRCDTERWIARGAELGIEGGAAVRGVLLGHPIPEDAAGTEVKAATWNDLLVEPGEGRRAAHVEVTLDL